jgi:N-acetylneuraminate synthase
LYQKAHTPWDWHEPIFKKCKELGLIAFSTPLEEKAVDFLETLNVPCYKIASFESIDLPLIKKVASTGKPVIISTGMATVAEIDEAIRTFKCAGGTDVLLLKCTSTYPASPDDINLVTIPHMRVLFGAEVGLSDHTLGVGVALASVALGATIIEKHFTLCRSDGGVDSVFSMEPEEMKILVEESIRAWEALGHTQYGPTENERKSIKFRRSLYIAEDMNNGDLFTLKNLRVVRPGYGLHPKYYKILLSKRINKSAKKGDPVTWDLIG